MYSLVFTNRMKRDLKLMKKRGKDINKLETVLEILISGNDLPEKYKDHQLKGKMKEFRECHIEPDWLLIYIKEETELIYTQLQQERMRIYLICSFDKSQTRKSVNTQ